MSATNRELAESQIQIALGNLNGSRGQDNALALAQIYTQLAFADSVDQLTTALGALEFPELAVKKCLGGLGFSIRPVNR